MKILHWTLPIAIGLLVLLPATVAAQNVVMRADIPFNFVVGERTLPAGQYLVTVEQDWIALRCPESGSSAAVGYASHAYRSDAQNGRLLFNSYGNTNILRKVWVPKAERGSLLPIPHIEREAQARSGKEVHTAIAAIPVLTR
jgi:hypothetical protein